MKRLFKALKKFDYLIFLIFIAIGGVISIQLTSRQEVLQFDAASYYSLAYKIVSQKIGLLNLFTQPHFIDLGYPIILSFLIRFFNNIVVYQLFNFLFWFLASLFVYKTLQLLTTAKRAFWGTLIMACSPIYLTFSAKLYSEPFASLGVAVILYFLLKYKIRKNYSSLIWLMFGMVIFFFTKSVYSLLVIPIVLMALTKRGLIEYFLVILAVLLIFTGLYFSVGEGRSNYNLAIQSAKVRQSYSTIGACSFYYLSYPVGKFVFPRYQGACHQNDPQVDMSGYSGNPYVVAANFRDEFSIKIWLIQILSNPIKYLTVILSSMTSIIFVEGVYGTVTKYFNSIPAVILFGSVKLIFAYYIWSNVVRNFRLFLNFGLGRALLSVIPLIYFFVVVGNFPVEQRYFFPLMPWIYFYAALDKPGIEKVISIFK